MVLLIWRIHPGRIVILLSITDENSVKSPAQILQKRLAPLCCQASLKSSCWISGCKQANQALVAESSDHVLQKKSRPAHHLC